MSYATHKDVEVLCPRIFNAPSGVPEATVVQNWIDEGAALIDARLTSAGYSAPVSSSAAAYKLFRHCNALYAACIVEMSRGTSQTAAAETGRSFNFCDRFERNLNSLLAMDLSGLGVSVSSAGQMYIGGISEDDKESVESDTDRIMTSFRRGQFAHPGAGTTTADTPGDSEERSD